MFRPTDLRGAMPALAIITLFAASGPALAQSGVSTERVYDPETGDYTVSRSVSGEDGGTYTTERTCATHEVYDAIQGCVSSRSATNADGQTTTRERMQIEGPVRTRSAGRFTNSDGDQTLRHRRWRN